MARFDPIEDVIDSLCLRSGDILRRNKGLYLDVAGDVFNDMNEDVLHIASRVKIPVRKEFKINKRTNSIDLPCTFLRLSSVNVIDECGVMYPVYRNMRLHDDIVDLSAKKDCACEFNCGGRLCNIIKGYEAVQQTLTDTMPDGTPVSFNAVNRKSVDKNGFLWEECQFIERVFTNGVWTNTVLKTELKKLCACEVDNNGCVCDTEKNLDLLCHHCASGCDSPQKIDCNIVCVGGTASAPPSPGCDTWIYYCDNKMDWFSFQCGCFPRGFREGCNNIYNISELQDRLIFPANFGWDKVVVRYYDDISLENLVVPYAAKNTFMTGMQYFAAEHNDNKQKLAAVYGEKYKQEKWGLFLELNKYRISELAEIFVPRSYVSSYMDHREDWVWRYFP